MRSSNPALNSNVFTSIRASTGEEMTISGTSNKTLLLLAIVFMAATFTWGKDYAGPFITIGLFGGLIFALITSFKPAWSPITAPIYGVFEGLFLGGTTSIIENMYPGIAFQAICLTFATMFILLLAYQSKWVVVTDKFKLGVFAATGAIFLFYLVNLILSFFGLNIPFLHDSGPLGIGISIGIVIIAALNIILDFDFIEQASSQGYPKYMEWYGAFALMVTLIWLYIEILNLLMKLRGRN